MATPPRFQLDEHVAPAVRNGLALRGVDVRRSKDAGLQGATDVEQFQHAWREGRVFVTHDRDLPRLHATNVKHAGIAYCNQGKHSIGDLLGALLRLGAEKSAEQMQNALEYL
jgi:predicted nuclease of predicted toxin-antitoxin system